MENFDPYYFTWRFDFCHSFYSLLYFLPCKWWSLLCTFIWAKVVMQKYILWLNKLLWTTVQLINNTKQSFSHSLMSMDLTVIRVVKHTGSQQLAKLMVDCGLCKMSACYSAGLFLLLEIDRKIRSILTSGFCNNPGITFKVL